MITLGQHDGMAIVYQHENYHIGEKDKPEISNVEKNEIKETNFALNNFFGEILMFNKPHGQLSVSNIDTLKDSLQLLKDSQLQLELCDEALPSWVHKIITKIVHPTTSNFEPLVSES